jgi:ppGpp synthetase/RelA/SpoT-type nucleotidyltranferase
VNDLEQARKRWLAEAAGFEAFGKLLESRLSGIVRTLGVHASISSRPKEIDSLLKKLIRKPHKTYADLNDKVGARVIVQYKPDVDAVVRLSSERLVCSSPDDKAGELEADRVGYLSVHLEVTLRHDDPAVVDFPPETYRAELQVRTLAQHLWSEMSHDVTYKSDTLLPGEIRRRVFLLAGLVEIADNEFTRLEHDVAELPNMPELRILRALERQYYKLTSRVGDPELSIAVIKALLPLYSNVPEWQSHFERLFAEREAIFRAVFDNDDPDRSAFLYQPEVLMIYEQLRADEIGLRRQWVKHFGERELERLAIVFGVSF